MDARRTRILNRTQGGSEVLSAQWCQTFMCRLRGLTFRRELLAGTGLLLVQERESRFEAAIHMWGVFFPLGVVWIARNHTVVDLRLALPWRFYLPAAPAQYILEGPPELLQSLSIGDELEFHHHADA